MATKELGSRAESMALAVGQDAQGARNLKKGFGFTPQQDLEWALGWPHVRYLADTSPLRHDGRPYIVFDDWQLVLPRATAIRIVRGYHHRPEDRSDAGKTTPRVRSLINRTTPIAAEEVTEIIRLHMRADSWYLPARFQRVLLVMESLVGTEPVVAAMVDALEAFKVHDLKKDFQTLYLSVLELGLMLVRLPASRHKAVVSRLEGVYNKAGKNLPALKKGKPSTQIIRALDLILHGKKAVPRSADGAPFGCAAPQSLLFVHDDPAFVLARARTNHDGPGGLEPESRLTFLGGDEILALELDWMGRYAYPQSASAVAKLMVEHYARIRSPRTVQLMMKLSQKSASKTRATRWLEEHRDQIR